MQFRRLLITGGAGFVGSNLAVAFKQHFADLTVVAADNLKRRGSELTLPRLRAHGVEFQHADVRCPEDLAELPPCDLLIDCSAEPSVHRGATGSPSYVLNTNLTGTLNCLELARRQDAAVVFLSTSRVYPIEALNALPYQETATRFVWTTAEHGVSEKFPLDGPRSMYGASKLSSELILQEYVASYRLPALVNRCGILTGPWQMGRVDQGVVALWCARHHYRRPLRYTGFGGTGKQVRDLLHVDDLFDLLLAQLGRLDQWTGRPFNVGGGNAGSVSLSELTELCRQVTGNTVAITSEPETSPLDLRIYITDARLAEQTFAWKPQRSPAKIVADIHQWIREHEQFLEPILA